jgi:hypothetical protein
MERYEDLILQKLENNDIITTKPMSFDRNLEKQYSQWHYASDLSCMKDIVHTICPEYDESFLHVFENNTLSSYCIFISRYELFNKYFEWLFPLLFEMEKRIDISKYDFYQKRVLAFLAERLLNIYVYHHKLRAVYEPVYFMDGGDEERNSIKKTIKEMIKYFIPHSIKKMVMTKKRKKAK